MLQVTSASIVSWTVFSEEASCATFRLKPKAVCADFGRPVKGYSSNLELEIRVANGGKGGNQVLLHMISKLSEWRFWAMRILSRKACSKNTWLERTGQGVEETLLNRLETRRARIMAAETSYRLQNRLQC